MSDSPATKDPVLTKWQGLLLWLGIVGTFGLLSFFRYYLAVLAEGGEGTFLKQLINEMTAAFGAGLLFFAVRWLAGAFPLERSGWKRHLPLYFAAMLLVSAVHTTMNWGFRAALYPLVGLGAYDYGIMPLRYAMELPYDVLLFWTLIAALYAVGRLRAAREQELRTAQLESGLARAELRNLRLQLQPHFLFNALNTISSTMYENPAAADEMLDRLAELLRASLRTVRTDEVPVGSELEVLDCYLEIMRARFGNRLHLDLEVEPDAREALVPSMILQPLVENAIRHGNAERLGQGHVAVRIRRRGAELLLEIEDDGPGRPASEDLTSPGVGFSATAERLRLLYGDAHRLEAANVPGGGFRVTVGLPWRERGEAAP